MFTMYDLDGNGFLSKDEFFTMLRYGRICPYGSTRKQSRQVVSEMTGYCIPGPQSIGFCTASLGQKGFVSLKNNQA